MTSPIVRLLAGLVAGSLTVLLIDQLVWPGTLVHGLVGVAAASATLASAQRKA